MYLFTVNLLLIWIFCVSETMQGGWPRWRGSNINEALLRLRERWLRLQERWWPQLQRQTASSQQQRRNPVVEIYEKSFFYRSSDARRIISHKLNISHCFDDAYTENLYRGLTYFPYRNLFIEDGFFSTTKDVRIALGFARGNILQIITRMYGVYIADYAEERGKRKF
ncbi:uncharacterized protein LOC128557185 [Mercenaria mercenaria]|uniref:uncharacterized protein LOC128557185 n=1 Tax=Mercenaria mercenaria TaxID=6596 RepID=UPI00234E8F0B|nr:uncharacterized protein LOC128557185 [Mercenaria mercenaria]